MRFIYEKLKSSLSPKWLELVEFVGENEKTLPNPRRSLLLIEKLERAFNGSFPPFLEGDFGRHVVKLFSYSQFLGEFFVRHKELLPELREIYRKKFLPSDFRFPFRSKNKREFMNELRVFKNFQMARVVLRDVLGLAPFTELLRDVTLIHDACLKAAYEFAFGELVKRYGAPNSTFIAVDMGKAGGFELNYSSDFDVIYVYGSRYGETQGGIYGSLQNHDFFTLLAQEVTNLLSESTEEGICFRVDTRLRPNGSMGPLVNDIEALENYYTAVARPWERIALLKARPSVGDLSGTGVEFVKLANAFVYRKYVDLSLIEEVLRVKEMIKAKVQKKGGKIDLKLGKGGIREVEFIVQAFQVIYGGKFPQIRSKNTVVALRKLLNWGFLSKEEYEELLESYLFLRKAEHMLQVTHFRQTQTFHPESEEAEELAKKLGFKTKGEFLLKLKEVMEKVNGYFNKFFPTGENKPLSSLSVEDLKKMGFKAAADVERFLKALISEKRLTPEERGRIDVMGERFLRLILDTPVPENTLKNLLLFIERREGKVFFFSVLSQENLLKLLFFLLSSKDFFISRVRETPEVIDYCFLPEVVESPITVSRIFRFFRDVGNLKLVKNTFEIAAVLRRKLARSKIEEFLSEITSVCEFCLSQIYREVDPDFSLACVGKLGSREMNVGSDLDLLFVSEKPVKTESAIELVKELESLGYEVDTRLRPFGEKGELVFTVSYLERYFREVARTWERLAFTRFRFLFGTLKERVEDVVKEFLFGEPLDGKVLSEIFSMRKRLEEEFPDSWLKYAPGGIVDLEFMAYTYQLYSRKWLRSTLDALKALSEEDERFRDGVGFYRLIREIEADSRLFGENAVPSVTISKVRENVRSLYEEFKEWMRSRV